MRERVREARAGGWGAAAALLAGAAGLLAAGVACGPGSPPPAPAPVRVDVDTVPRGPTWAAAPSTYDPTAALPAAPVVVPPSPWVPPAVGWEPAAPEEGSALALHLTRRAVARDPLFVDADLGGVPVHLTRTATGWFGLAAIPIGTAGPQILSLRFGVAPDSVEERMLPLEVAPRAWPSARLRIGSRTGDVPPRIRARLERERRRIRETVERVSPDWLAEGGFDWPRRDRITSPFGQRRIFAGEVRSLHLGLDVAGRPGERVVAAGAGRVALTGSFLLQGNAVYVDHGLGVYTAYFHLSRIEAREGDAVARGQVLGRVGSTGRVTGPHLHWSLYVAGQSLDPRSVLDLRLGEAGVPAADAGEGIPAADGGAAGDGVPAAAGSGGP